MKAASVDATDTASYCALIGELMEAELNFLLAKQ